MSLSRWLVEQFHHPRGLPGRLAGWIMATRTSNLERNLWTIGLLELEPTDKVLELGPGPGVTLTLLLNRLPQGQVTAVDHSRTMLAQCFRANRKAVEAGCLELIQGPFAEVDGIAGGRAPFDAILAVNSLQFDGLNASTLGRVGHLLAPGGRLAITFQPRTRRSTAESALEFGNHLAELLRDAGLDSIRIETLPLKPVCAVCVLARRSEPAIVDEAQEVSGPETL